MPTIQLSPEQVELLRQILEVALSGLRVEIMHTDHREYRDMLVARRDQLQTVIAKVEEQRAARPTGLSAPL
jgi:hypothetical protein